MDWFINLPLLAQALLASVILINLVTFFYFGWDKLRAEVGRRRVSEKMLWLLMLAGGSLGGLLGMHFFRHKTQKLSFQMVVAVILLVQISVVVWMVRSFS